jgi:ABC-type branched-subunit amino acid transport system permease subunit
MWWGAFVAALVLSVAAQLFIDAKPDFAVESLFGWYALYGFIACAALILVAKGIGVFLKRRDDYYD